MDNFELWYRFNSNRKTQGLSPLSFTANREPLKNWTIYGRTSPNIFDISAVSLDSAIDENGDVIVQDGSSVSDLIPISTTEGLWLSGDLQQGGTSLSRMICYTYYDENKVKISTGVVSWPNSGRVTYEFTQIPVTASYIRIQYTTALWNDIMMNACSMALTYEAYGNVGDKTANVLPRPAIESVGTTTKNGVTFTVTETGQVFISGTANSNTNHVVNLSESFVIPKSVSDGGSGTFAMNNNKTAGSNVSVVLGYDTVDIDQWLTTTVNRTHNAYSIMGEKTINNYRIIVTRGYTLPLDFSLGLAFSNNGIYVTPYEPYGYKIPVTCGGVTTNIYLDHPLGDGESISMADTGIAIPTTNGENILSVDTAVSPSNVAIVTSKILKNTEAYFRYKYDVLRKRDY